MYTAKSAIFCYLQSFASVIFEAGTGSLNQVIHLIPVLVFLKYSVGVLKWKWYV